MLIERGCDKSLRRKETTLRGLTGGNRRELREKITRTDGRDEITINNGQRRQELAVKEDENRWKQAITERGDDDD